MRTVKTAWMILFIAVFLASCGSEPEPKIDSNKAAAEEAAKKATEEKAKKEIEAKAKAEKDAQIRKDADAKVAADEQQKQLELAEKAKAEEEANRLAAETVAKTATQNDTNIKLEVGEYTKELFGYSDQPQIVNTNWQSQLNQNFDYYHNLCGNNGSTCPIPNYQIFYDTGYDVGSNLFDQFYGQNNTLLTCNGNFNNYFGGFVQGGWLNNIQVVIDVSIFVNGQLFNRENFQENQYAPILIQRIIQAFEQKYNAIFNNPNQCYRPPIITAPVIINPCASGICQTPQTCSTGGGCQQPINFPQSNGSYPIYVNSCNNQCGYNYNSAQYGNVGINGSVGGSHTNYGGSSVNTIGWNVSFGAVGNW